MFPKISRARAFRIYGGGRRFVDLWLSGGEALMGHKSAYLARDIKNLANRGLFAPLPAAAARRFDKALERLFPGKTFKIYADWSVFPDYKKLPVWRPFSSLPDWEKAGAFRPVLPFPLAPAVVVCEKSFLDDYPSGGYVSPLLLTAATRSIYDMLACPERSVMRFAAIKKAFELPETQKNWRLDGIYIYPVNADMTEEVWGLTFRRFMEGGFLLPPDRYSPLILPSELSKGEERALANLLMQAF